MGLFEDLQHVNPFDETFRRAVESDRGNQSESFDSVKCNKPKLTTQTTLEALTMHNEETLHTPNVLPYLESASTSIKCLKSAISFDDELIHPIGHSMATLETMQVVGASTSGKAQKREESNPVDNKTPPIDQNGMKTKNILLISNVVTPCLVPTQPTPNPSTKGRPLKKLFPKKMQVNENSIKERLKQLILQARGTKTTTTTTTPAAKDHGMVISCRPTNTERLQPKKQSNNEKCTIQNEIFERNRAASQRYRVKVKKKQSCLRQRNAELEAENERLRTELKSIKTILLSHQNCSVTRAANQCIITLQTKYATGNESKPSILYLVDNNKSTSEPSGKC